MATPRRKKSDDRETEKRVRSGAAIQAFIDPDVRAAMDRFIDDFNNSHDHKAGVTSTVEAALKKYLAAEGYWPPKPPR